MYSVVGESALVRIGIGRKNDESQSLAISGGVMRLPEAGIVVLLVVVAVVAVAVAVVVVVEMESFAEEFVAPGVPTRGDLALGVFR